MYFAAGRGNYGTRVVERQGGCRVHSAGFKGFGVK